MHRSTDWLGVKDISVSVAMMIKYEILPNNGLLLL
jgi:hypothetical protein